MYKIAICDDDKNYREKIEKVIETEGILPKSEIRFYEYESGKELLENADILHDLVFMDMRMPGLDGNKSVLKLREYNRAAILVFCSGYFEPTPDSINIGQPFRYIMKDLHDRSLKREIPAILSKVKLHCGDYSVTVTSAGRVIRIYTEDILYICLAKRGCSIYVARQGEIDEMHCKESLGDLYERLAGRGFEYAHNSYIVNLAKVEGLEKNELMGILGKGSDRSRLLSKNLNVPMYTDIKEINQNVDAACVVVPNAAGGGNGANIAKSILAKGIPTLLEHPAHEVEIVNCIRESGSAAFMLNPFYRYIKPIRDFLEAAQIISKHAHLINASLECAIHVLYDGIDILGCALGGLSTWKLGNVAESYTTSMAGGGNRVISGIIGMVPVTFIVNTNVDRNDIDHPLHLYHRIELTFSTGRLCLVNTHGPVIWLPFLHMPRDEYGTLSINVEEEVNIPSGVTIGNVMLPSVKETFEQIWPDAVKKALEILFKQNRTEKMSMAQYQIYVSKLWSEICQKVGYMNIVDYDNFGDIKSIFYDLEKRHLIKKENDGIE